MDCRFTAREITRFHGYMASHSPADPPTYNDLLEWRNLVHYFMVEPFRHVGNSPYYQYLLSLNDLGVIEAETEAYENHPLEQHWSKEIIRCLVAGIHFFHCAHPSKLKRYLDYDDTIHSENRFIEKACRIYRKYYSYGANRNSIIIVDNDKSLRDANLRDCITGPDMPRIFDIIYVSNFQLNIGLEILCKRNNIPICRVSSLRDLGHKNTFSRTLESLRKSCVRLCIADSDPDRETLQFLMLTKHTPSITVFNCA